MVTAKLVQLKKYGAMVTAKPLQLERTLGAMATATSTQRKSAKQFSECYGNGDVGVT